jgi:hypothetical protein
MESLVSTHVMLGSDQKKQLRVWAADRDTSMASLVREAINYYLRVAVGPYPEQVRRNARNAVGVVPRAPADNGGPSGDGHGVWWVGEA